MIDEDLFDVLSSEFQLSPRAVAWDFGSPVGTAVSFVYPRRRDLLVTLSDAYAHFNAHSISINKVVVSLSMLKVLMDQWGINLQRVAPPYNICGVPVELNDAYHDIFLLVGEKAGQLHCALVAHRRALCKVAETCAKLQKPLDS